MGQLPSSGDPSILCVLCSNLNTASTHLGLPKGSCENLSHLKSPVCVKPYIASISLRAKPKVTARLYLQGPAHSHPLDFSHPKSSYTYFLASLHTHAEPTPPQSLSTCCSLWLECSSLQAVPLTLSFCAGLS